MKQRDLEVIVWGATGFTGQLVCKYLFAQYGANRLAWAMGGRSREKLERVREQLGATARSIALLTADSHDRASLGALVGKTRAVLTTVGPYALYGSELLAACATHGTDYCDLSGEVPWMRRMLDTHAAAAAASGARIVHCCGFDAIPSDLGVLWLNNLAQARTGKPCHAIRYRLKSAKGGISGGTIASMLNLLTEARRDAHIARIVKNPYALCPPDKRRGPRQPYVASAAYDGDLGVWTGPFVMAVINTRVVHKSNALSNYAYGPGFQYDEAVITGPGLRGRLGAQGMTAALRALVLGATLTPTRTLMQKLLLPKPGRGPSGVAREEGFFDIVFTGDLADGSRLRARVRGDRDPGYGSTSKMIGEAAICLARDITCEQVPGGIWTPATAMGETLLKRLTRHAGLSFDVES